MDFVTERLRLTPRTLAHLEASYELDQQPGVLDYVQGPWHDPVLHRAFIHDRITRDYGPGLGYWSVFAHSEPERFLGWVLLIPVNAVGPQIEIGWRLRPEHWGQGYATEAARTLLHYAFAERQLVEVIADIAPANEASKRVALKIGLRQTDRVSNGYQRFELTAAEFCRQ